MKPGSVPNAWWEHFLAGRVTIPLCQACDGQQFPLRAVCQHCKSDERMHFEDAGQPAKVVAMTTVHTTPVDPFSKAVPFVICTFDFSEIVRISLPICRMRVRPPTVGSAYVLTPCQDDPSLPFHVSIELVRGES